MINIQTGCSARSKQQQIKEFSCDRHLIIFTAKSAQDEEESLGLFNHLVAFLCIVIMIITFPLSMLFCIKVNTTWPWLNDRIKLSEIFSEMFRETFSEKFSEKFSRSAVLFQYYSAFLTS